ncbi:MAG: amidohydrolase [Planctomycetes bacterium]|nr:amidohydrolase [Planctomycetota bacterium]
MSLVDFHTHYFSRVFFDTLAAQSPLPGTPAEKLEALARKTGIELPPSDGAQHRERWLSVMREHGIAHLASFASLPEEIAEVGAAALASDGRISGFALLNPRAPGCAEKAEAALAGGGHKGVLLFPALHGYCVDQPEVRPLFEVLERRKAIAFVHCGLFVVKLRDLLGFPRTQDLRRADPLALIPVANAFPNVRFVIPHFGAGFLRETLMAGAQCPNVYVDSSSSNAWMATQCPRVTLREVFERALEVFGPARVLFGTDSTVFPAGWQAKRHEEQRALLGALGASAPDQERIFAGNARALLGLPPSATSAR